MKTKVSEIIDLIEQRRLAPKPDDPRYDLEKLNDYTTLRRKGIIGFFTPSVKSCYWYSMELKKRLSGNPNLLVAVVLSGTSEENIEDAMAWTDHGGSVALEYNPTVAEAFPAIYAQRDTLPKAAKRNLEWMAQVHKYPTL